MEKSFFSFKKLFIAFIFGAIPFAFLIGLLSFFNVSAVYFNGAPAYGIKGFIISILCVPLFGVVFTITNWMTLNLGWGLYRLFLQIIKKDK